MFPRAGLVIFATLLISPAVAGPDVGQPPFAFFIEVEDATLVTWAVVAPPEPGDVVYYNVYGDGELLTTTPLTAYLDPVGHSSYLVKAVIDGSEGPGQPASPIPCAKLDATVQPPKLYLQDCPTLI